MEIETEIEVIKTRLDFLTSMMKGALFVTGLNFLGILLAIVKMMLG